MIDRDSLIHIQNSAAQAIEASQDAIQHTFNNIDALPYVALPEGHKLHAIDTEKHQPYRQRFTGQFCTSSPDDFIEYCLNAGSNESKCFINPENRSAKCIINFGTRAQAGHCDDTATYTPSSTAEYDALLEVSQRGSLSQKTVAEFLEDWKDNIQCYNTDQQLIEIKRAINATRKITITAKTSKESEKQQFSSAQSSLASVEANTNEDQPAYIEFTCSPFLGFNERSFMARVSINSDDDAPRLHIRIIQMELHKQQMAEELQAMLTEAFNEKIHTVIGAFSV